MLKKEIKINQKVFDRWFIEWGYGIVKEIKKTRVIINFFNKGKISFDNAHLQFLETNKSKCI
jgi:hypothetical protein